MSNYCKVGKITAHHGKDNAYNTRIMEAGVYASHMQLLRIVECPTKRHRGWGPALIL